jgi:uncharacterized cupredoxin-like copper-binding protein
MTTRQLAALSTVVIAGVAVAPAALGAAHPRAHAAKTSVAVTAKEYKFTLKPTSARHGSVTFTIKNTGKLAHDLKIAGKRSPKVNPKKTTTLTVTLKKGKYPYLCTIPGHAAAGMKGTYTVR